MFVHHLAVKIRRRDIIPLIKYHGPGIKRLKNSFQISTIPAHSIDTAERTRREFLNTCKRICRYGNFWDEPFHSYRPPSDRHRRPPPCRFTLYCRRSLTPTIRLTVRGRRDVLRRPRFGTRTGISPFSCKGQPILRTWRTHRNPVGRIRGRRRQRGNRNARLCKRGFRRDLSGLLVRNIRRTGRKEKETDYGICERSHDFIDPFPSFFPSSVDIAQLTNSLPPRPRGTASKA